MNHDEARVAITTEIENYRYFLLHKPKRVIFTLDAKQKRQFRTTNINLIKKKIAAFLVSKTWKKDRCL